METGISFAKISRVEIGSEYLRDRVQMKIHGNNERKRFPFNAFEVEMSQLSYVECNELIYSC